jgi:predicted  nucleic acid-binding Zn-ribbon protein
VTACQACNLKKGRIRLAHYLASDTDAYRNFQQYAIHVWKRHLAAIEEEIRNVRRKMEGTEKSLSPRRTPRTRGEF